MNVISMPLGPVQANCYIVMENGHALVFDPGSDFDIESIMKKYNVVVDAIVLTHAHFDHIGGVDALEKKVECPVYLNPNEFDFLNNPEKNSSSAFFNKVSIQTKPLALKEGIQKIGNFELEAIFCPGHSIGSTVFKIGQCLITGDVLFSGSIGRTDLYSGSSQQMQESLHKIKNINGFYHVLPGHGDFSTLDEEKKNNYYLN